MLRGQTHGVPTLLHRTIGALRGHRGELAEVFLGTDQYSLVVIPPQVWNGFKGMSEPYAIVANCATLPHDPARSERLDPFNNAIPYKWDVRHH